MTRSKISQIVWHALVTSDRKNNELRFADQSCGADMQGVWPRVGALLLTPGNARRAATERSRMRRAAMKVA